MMRLDGDPLSDLNDLRFFVEVVEHGGFSAAGRALGVPKSRLSNRVAKLEERLGVRLLQRTTRRFVVTDVGERFLAHCKAMIEQAEAARDVVEELRSEPCGWIRLSCPISLAPTVMAELVPEFLARYPKMQVRLLVSDRRVDLIGEAFDIAIRVRNVIDTDATLVLRTIGQSRVILVASPGFLEHHGTPRSPQELAPLPLLSMRELDGLQALDLAGPAGEREQVRMQPRLVCGSFPVLVNAAVRGIGVALVPDMTAAAAIARGELIEILPDWSMPEGIFHFVYPTRRGLLPGVRAMVDFLAERLRVA
ncbi:MAG: LysR substrate-binding domain-containing protein [Dokdonella sp.]|nr:LysR family transcriptional regulator [Dokdonella sp.]MCB1571106.1 LysR family transcriptional regulator [Xanthomonadales bacterium]MCB1573951.1 LysR family transcriptional regulator [Xanthomonadales bacterium]